RRPRRARAGAALVALRYSRAGVAGPRAGVGRGGAGRLEGAGPGEGRRALRSAGGATAVVPGWHGLGAPDRRGRLRPDTRGDGRPAAPARRARLRARPVLRPAWTVLRRAVPRVPDRGGRRGARPDDGRGRRGPAGLHGPRRVPAGARRRP